MKITVGLILAILLGAMSLSLFNISAGMDMSGNMPDCPFAQHTEVICAMDVSDHISAWKAIFTATIPTLTLLSLAVLTFAVAFSIAPHLFKKQRPRISFYTRQLRERTYSYSYRPLQELFSNGILHPKLF